MKMEDERMGEKKNACSILVEKPEGKRPTERFRHRGEYNIKTGLRYTVLRFGLDSSGSG
jgi:hypothetical protein